MDIIKVVKDSQGYTFKTPIYINLILKCGELFLTKDTVYTTTEIPIIDIYKRENITTSICRTRNDIPEISIDEYFNTLKCLESKKNDSYVWNTLEDEYAYKAFSRDYKPMTIDQLIKVGTVQLNIEEYISSPSIYIIPFRHVGGNIISTKALYKRQECMISTIKKTMEKYGYFDENDKTIMCLDMKKFKIFSYNKGMVSLYINGKNVIDLVVNDIADEMKTVIDKMNTDILDIKNKIKTYISSVMAVKFNLSDVISHMKTISNMTVKIDPKIKSRNDKRAVMFYIERKIKEYEEFAISIESDS